MLTGRLFAGKNQQLTKDCSILLFALFKVTGQGGCGARDCCSALLYRFIF